MTTPAAHQALPTYRDKGCDIAAACLSCPFLVCQFDLPFNDDELSEIPRAIWLIALFRYDELSRYTSAGEVATYLNILADDGAQLFAALHWIRAYLRQ